MLKTKIPVVLVVRLLNEMHVCSFAYEPLVDHPLNEPLPPPPPQQVFAKRSIISTTLDKYVPVRAAVYGSHIVQ